MIGLISSHPSCAACSNIEADQSNHSSSSLSRSSNTLASTRVATSASRQLHDLIRRHRAGPPPAHVLDNLPPARAYPWLRGLRNPHSIPLDGEFDLGVREQPELVPNLHRDGHLPLARNP